MMSDCSIMPACSIISLCPGWLAVLAIIQPPGCGHSKPLRATLQGWAEAEMAAQPLPAVLERSQARRWVGPPRRCTLPTGQQGQRKVPCGVMNKLHSRLGAARHVHSSYHKIAS